MRKRTLGAVLLGTAVVLGGLVPAGAGQDTIGTYLAPFREDGATYNAATNTFSGGHYDHQATDANGCVADASNISPPGNPQAYRCMPAGATMVALPNG
ncbi:MAG: hypothetical protein JO085_00800, partial [Acidimicrobiia bacterium]|nr:hypothetical protein [Acidimicrobiia bacterium]